MISHGQRQRVVHDFPKYSVKVLPWLSPEVLQQVCRRSPKESLSLTNSQFPEGAFRNFPRWGCSDSEWSKGFQREGFPAGWWTWEASQCGRYVPLADGGFSPSVGSQLDLMLFQFPSETFLMGRVSILEILGALHIPPLSRSMRTHTSPCLLHNIRHSFHYSISYSSVVQARKVGWI